MEILHFHFTFEKGLFVCLTPYVNNFFSMYTITSITQQSKINNFYSQIKDEKCYSVCLYVGTHVFVQLYESLACVFMCICIYVHMLRLGASSSHDIRALNETILSQFYKIFKIFFLLLQGPSKSLQKLLLDYRRKDCSL